MAAAAPPFEPGSLDRRNIKNIQAAFDSGSYGTAHLALYQGQTVVLKKTDTGNPAYMAMLKSEKDYLAQLSHPHIVQLIGWVDSPLRRDFFLVLEYLSEGEITGHLFPDAGPILTQVLDLRPRFVREILEAVCFLHSRNIIHGDLRLENILLDNHFNVKIIDFGFARALNPSNSSLNVNLLEQPGTNFLPSVAGDPAYDILFLANVLWEILAVQRTEGYNSDRWMYPLTFILTSAKNFPQNWPLSLISLFRSLWGVQAEGRPSAAKVLEIFLAIHDSLLSPLDPLLPLAPKWGCVFHSELALPWDLIQKQTLDLLMLGHLKALKKVLLDLPELLDCSLTGQDPSERYFESVTLLQYAAWAQDFEAVELFRQYLHPITFKAQLGDLMRRTLVYGSCFSYQPLIDVINHYLLNLRGESFGVRSKYILKNIGQEQLKLPAHRMQMYYCFTTLGERTLALNQGTVYKIFEDYRLGREYAIVRGPYFQPMILPFGNCAQINVDACLFADFTNLNRLESQRVEQWSALQAEVFAEPESGLVSPAAATVFLAAALAASPPPAYPDSGASSSFGSQIPDADLLGSLDSLSLAPATVFGGQRRHACRLGSSASLSLTEGIEDDCFV